MRASDLLLRPMPGAALQKDFSKSFDRALRFIPADRGLIIGMISVDPYHSSVLRDTVI
jgi:hypothetical protein